MSTNQCGLVSRHLQHLRHVCLVCKCFSQTVDEPCPRRLHLHSGADVCCSLGSKSNMQPPHCHERRVKDAALQPMVQSSLLICGRVRKAVQHGPNPACVLGAGRQTDSDSTCSRQRAQSRSPQDRTTDPQRNAAVNDGPSTRRGTHVRKQFITLGRRLLQTVHQIIETCEFRQEDTLCSCAQLKEKPSGAVTVNTVVC